MGPRELGELLASRGPGLVLYARQWTVAPEDVVQDAFVKLSEQRPIPDQVVPWLYRVVRNQAISMARAEKRRLQRETRAARPNAWFAPSDRLDAQAAADALATLPDDEREAIVLHLWGGLTFAEIAAVVESSASSVHRWYSAGIDRLRERLETPCRK